MLNRFLILVMLLALLYALYKYQQYMPSGNNKSITRIRTNAKTINYNPSNETPYKTDNNIDIITTDCISQKSINSLSDIKSKNNWNDGITELLED